MNRRSILSFLGIGGVAAASGAKAALPSPSQEVPYNTTKTYKAKVVDANDPVKLGRLKIRISELHDHLTDSELPWVPIKRPSLNAASLNSAEYISTLEFHPIPLETWQRAAGLL